jgi:preprotein translocase subunit SecA
MAMMGVIMLQTLGKVFVKLLGGSRNERIVRNRMKIVRERINPLEDRMRALSDEQMRELSDELAGRLADGEPRDSVLPEAFALIREASWRAIQIRQFDVQLVAGMILDEGSIAEEATGEGKTFACYPAIFLACLEGKKVHVITVNDYLVQRDAELARPVFERLGLTVGYITNTMRPAERQPAYACNITYGTNSEFGFDYMRDNMKLSVAEQVQGPLDFAIVDEIDNILIDEARTPLIISGPAYGDTTKYRKADQVARQVIQRNRAWDQANRNVQSAEQEVRSLEGELAQSRGPEADAVREKLAAARARLEEAEADLDRHTKLYEIELDKKSAHLTDEGVQVAQEIAGVGSFYVGANMEWPHLMEQALRAHLVYEKDKEYVVREGKVVIVDEFTGRLLEGREWSDGLHQAVEAKENVQVKEENQTLATITIQNYFKLYGKLAGMTGTAMTEAEEFMKIYGLDVANVPTHRPINRMDFNDRIYADEPAKFAAIVEEVHEVSRGGRPVLVGTTSIERSERLSEMLTRKYGIEHDVLNARPENAAREADIVKLAGQQRPLKQGSKERVGRVTIATNMAGRGTDIKLGEGVVYDKCQVPPDETLTELGVEASFLYPAGVNKCCIRCQEYDAASNCAHCFKPKLDPAFPARGRDECPQAVPCGLHIVGTERHEARRIDNQLRGRAGRQGDPGSSRFCLSVRDELLTIFAGEWVLKVLRWLGLQGDMAIEDKRVSKGIERAQKKVEERNFEVRKNLLEYDEVMDHQRREFYSRRQKVLEGRELEGLVLEMLLASVDQAVDSYLDGRYAQRCIAEYARQQLQVAVEPERIKADSSDDLEALQEDLRERAKDEARGTIGITLGEYMDEALDPSEWDLRGLSGWAMSRFQVQLSQNQLRKMQPDEVSNQLAEAAAEQIDRVDLTGLADYLREDFAARSLADWFAGKFGVQVEADKLTGSVADARQVLADEVRNEYARREVAYPVEHIMELTVAQAGTDSAYALESLVTWANRKYDADFTAEDFRNARLDEIHQKLLAESNAWLAEGKLEQAVRTALGDTPQADRAIDFARQRFDIELSPEEFNGDVTGVVIDAGRRFLRREMTELERFVLLQIYDSSWKDHLLAMDHLKGSIGLRGYAEQDPRVAFKREGSSQFQAMLDGVRDKVTDMIFKVRLSAQPQMQSVYDISSTAHDQLQGYDHLAQDAATQQQAAEPVKVQTITRDVPKVGRNDPCPCGSGKKYKKCCGRTA